MTTHNLKKLFEVTKKQWLIQHQDETMDIAHDNFDGGMQHADHIEKEVRKKIEEMEDTYFKYKMYENGITSGLPECQPQPMPAATQQQFSF